MSNVTCKPRWEISHIYIYISKGKDCNRQIQSVHSQTASTTQLNTTPVQPFWLPASSSGFNVFAFAHGFCPSATLELALKLSSRLALSSFAPAPFPETSPCPPCTCIAGVNRLTCFTTSVSEADCCRTSAHLTPQSRDDRILSNEVRKSLCPFNFWGRSEEKSSCSLVASVNTNSHPEVTAELTMCSKYCIRSDMNFSRISALPNTFRLDPIRWS